VKVLGMSNSFINITYKEKFGLQNECHLWKGNSFSLCVPQGFVLILTQVTTSSKYLGRTP
jgi:hypothetical protein